MIKCRLLMDRREGNWLLRMEGHAGHGKAGEDIVCAGASALCYAWLGWACNADVAHTETIDSGHVTAAVFGPSEVAEEPFRMLLIGLRQLEKKYPGNITVSFDDRESRG